MSMFSTNRLTTNFNDAPPQIVAVADEKNWYTQEAKNFSDLIDRRLEYTDSLKDLPDIWISGNSVKPDTNAIEQTKNVLKSVRDFIVQNYSLYNQYDNFSFDVKRTETSNFPVIPIEFFSTPLPIPKLVMSPIPTGGINMEFHIPNNNCIYITIPNKNKKVTIEKQSDNYFSDVDLDSLDTPGALIDEYSTLSRM